LFFFVPDNHDRFKFSSRGVAQDGTWEIAFSEKPGSALIHSPDWRAIPVSGIIQVLPQNGVVVRTMLKVDSKQGTLRGTGQIDVRYSRVDALGMWLPGRWTSRSRSRRARARGRASRATRSTATTGRSRRASASSRAEGGEGARGADRTGRGRRGGRQ